LYLPFKNIVVLALLNTGRIFLEYMAFFYRSSTATIVWNPLRHILVFTIVNIIFTHLLAFFLIRRYFNFSVFVYSVVALTGMFFVDAFKNKDDIQ